MEIKKERSKQDKTFSYKRNSLLNSFSSNAPGAGSVVPMRTLQVLVWRGNWRRTLCARSLLPFLPDEGEQRGAASCRDRCPLALQTREPWASWVLSSSGARRQQDSTRSICSSLRYQRAQGAIKNTSTVRVACNTKNSARIDYSFKRFLHLSPSLHLISRIS
jgi:hypothetical protein